MYIIFLLFIFFVSPIVDSENSFQSFRITTYTLVLIFRYVAIHQLYILQRKRHFVLLGRRFWQQMMSLSP